MKHTVTLLSSEIYDTLHVMYEERGVRFNDLMFNNLFFVPYTNIRYIVTKSNDKEN